MKSTYVIYITGKSFFIQEWQHLEEMRKQEMETDDMAPFLAQRGDPEKITRQQVYKLKEDCLMDLKQRLIDKANLINARFEKVDGVFVWI